MPIATEAHFHIWVLSEDGMAFHKEPFVYRSRTPAYRSLTRRRGVPSTFEGQVRSCMDAACDVRGAAVCPACGHQLHRTS